MGGRERRFKASLVFFPLSLYFWFFGFPKEKRKENHQKKEREEEEHTSPTPRLEGEANNIHKLGSRPRDVVGGRVVIERERVLGLLSIFS